MPNLKSQMKRAKTNVERQKANIPYKSGIKNTIKQLEQAALTGDVEQATLLYNRANSLLDKAMARKVHHRNFVRRKKSKVSRLYNQAHQAQTQ